MITFTPEIVIDVTRAECGSSEPTSVAVVPGTPCEGSIVNMPIGIGVGVGVGVSVGVSVGVGVGVFVGGGTDVGTGIGVGTVVGSEGVGDAAVVVAV